MMQKIKGMLSYYLVDISLVALIPLLFFLAKFYFHFVIWVAFAPIVFLTYKRNFKAFLYYSLIFTFLVSFLHAYYIQNFSQKYFFIAFFYIFITYFLTTLSLYWLYKKITYPNAIFVYPTVWFAFFTISNFIQGGNMWFNFSVLQPMLFPLPWLLGAEGISFLIILFSSLVAFYAINKEKKVLYSIITLSIFLFGCFLYSYFTVPTGAKIKVALIQGNFRKGWDWRIANATNEIFNTYSKLSREAAKEKPDIIIWPEYAIPEDIFTNQELYNKVSQLAKDTNANLVFGAIGKTDLTDPEYNYIKNVAHVFSRKGEYLGGYVSVMPFPFNEKIIAGTEFPVFNTDVGTFGISTCWEENYDFVDKQYASAGANFIISLANNEPIQSLKEIGMQAMKTRFSAAVNRRYVVRVTNTGITQVINPYGRVTAELEPRQAGYLVADIYINK